MFFSDWGSLVDHLQALKSQHKKIVFTNGCFDLLHIGHVRYLQQAQSLGDFLVVGVNSDASVKRLKGESRPLQVEEDRAQILAALGCVGATVLFEQDTPLELIQKISPNVLVKGGDWSKDQIVGADWVLDHGGEVQSLQFVDGRSTTKIINKIN